MVNEAEKIFLALTNEEFVVAEQFKRAYVRHSSLGRDEKMKTDESPFADWLANARKSYRIYRGGTPEENDFALWQASTNLVACFDYGQTWRYFEKGDGMLKRLAEAEALNKSLAQDIDRLTTDRDAWKKRAFDCEAVKFGTNVSIGDVEEPK
jgi:hypothetical protein